MHFFCSKYPDSVSFCISGDKNELSFDSILSLRPGFKQCVEDPTRLSPPAILDVIITDLARFYRRPVCEKALEVDKDKVGSDSNHLMVLMVPVDNFNNKKGSLRKHIQYRPLNDAGFCEMESRLTNYDWSSIQNIKSSDDQMLAFHNTLYDMFDESFPMKSKTFFSQSEPWFTEKLSVLKRTSLKSLRLRKLLSYLRLTSFSCLSLPLVTFSYLSLPFLNLHFFSLPFHNLFCTCAQPN